MLKVKNQGEIAEIYISGDIIDDADGAFIKEWYNDTTGYEFPQKVKEELDSVKDKPLIIYINSYGGSIPAGCAMANMIARHDAPTTAIVDGYCCSIATQIFFSADVCKMPSNTYLMIHKPLTFTIGNADEMRAEAERLDVLQKGLESTYQKKKIGGVTDEEIHKMVNAETWLTGAEAIQYFDIELIEPMKAVNCAGSLEKLKTLHYQRIPKTLTFKDDGNKNLSSFLIEQNKKIEIAIARAKGMMI
ncbi:MAG: Clp protease ClpP [Selenomonadaceae bacterium]|nr:Clp protease ClpP [Selenomonadaceae bacterium]MBR1730688.1 Clp protease ClpP [Selenomonadaceae bacterium]